MGFSSSFQRRFEGRELRTRKAKLQRYVQAMLAAPKSQSRHAVAPMRSPLNWGRSKQ